MQVLEDTGHSPPAVSQSASLWMVENRSLDPLEGLAAGDDVEPLMGVDIERPAGETDAEAPDRTHFLEPSRAGLIECAPCRTWTMNETRISDGYLVVVPAGDLTLFEYLEQRFKGDPGVSVLVDRRKALRPPPTAAARAVVLAHGVTVVRPGRAASSPPDTRRQTMTDVSADLEDRQRVDRWLEESQYLLGRMIPGYLDDRERLKLRLAGAEADNERLRLEVDGLRRDVTNLLAELQQHRSEQAVTAEAFAAVLGQLNDLQKPLTEVHRRLQAVHAPALNGAHAHA